MKASEGIDTRVYSVESLLAKAAHIVGQDARTQESVRVELERVLEARDGNTSADVDNVGELYRDWTRDNIDELLRTLDGNSSVIQQLDFTTYSPATFWAKVFNVKRKDERERELVIHQLEEILHFREGDAHADADNVRVLYTGWSNENIRELIEALK